MLKRVEQWLACEETATVCSRRLGAPGVARLVDLLTQTDEVEWQLRACRCLCNVAACEEEELVSWVMDAAVHFMHLMQVFKHCEELALMAIWTVGNLAASGFGKQLINNGVVPALAKLLRVDALASTAAWTLDKLCRVPGAQDEIAVHSLDQLVQLVQFGDEEVLWLVANMTLNAPGVVQSAYEAGLFDALDVWMDTEDPTFVSPLVRALGNLATHCDAPLSPAGVALLQRCLLDVQDSPSKQEASFAACNLCAGSAEQRQQVTSSGLDRALAHLLSDAQTHIRPLAKQLAQYGLSQLST